MIRIKNNSDGELLTKNVSKCKEYKTQLQNKLTSLLAQYKAGEISKDQYLTLKNKGLNGKSYASYIDYYQELGEFYQSKLAAYQGSARKKGALVTSIVISLLVIISFSLINQSGITGEVIYTKIEESVDALNMEFEDSGEFVWKPEEFARLNSISISGELLGEGSVEVYLDLVEESKLVYASSSPTSFESECGGACYLYETSQEEYIFRIVLSGNAIFKLEKIHYLLTDLEEFVVAPSNLTIDLTTNRFIKNTFGIYNSRNSNFKVAIYGEGELTKYLVLNTSYEEFTESDNLKKVLYTIDLPLDIKSGTYYEQIVVRFLPDGKFKGEAPIEIHNIIVNVGASELASPEIFSLRNIFIIVLLIIFGANLIFFLRKKDFKFRK